MTAPTSMEVLLARRGEFLAYLERRLRDPALAEDVLHDAFARALPHMEGDDPPKAQVPWFYQVLRNAVIDATRRRDARRRASSALEREPVELPVAPGRPCECVHGALDALPLDYSSLLRKVTMGGQPLSDYAATAGITSGNAGVRAHRARAALKREVERVCGACADDGCLDCTCGC